MLFWSFGKDHSTLKVYEGQFLFRCSKNDFHCALKDASGVVGPEQHTNEWV